MALTSPGTRNSLKLLQNFTFLPSGGIAPVTETSGTKKWVHFRWACAKFLPQNFHEWAGYAIGHSV